MEDNDNIMDRVRLERELDRLSTSTDPDVQQRLTAARAALEQRRWDLARQEIDAAKQSHRAAVSLLDLLVRDGIALSRAHARRMVAQGLCTVNGTVAREDENVAGKSVQVGARVIQRAVTS